MQDANLHIGSSLGFSVLLKDTSVRSERAGLEPALLWALVTRRLLNNLGHHSPISHQHVGRTGNESKSLFLNVFQVLDEL